MQRARITSYIILHKTDLAPSRVFLPIKTVGPWKGFPTLFGGGRLTYDGLRETARKEINDENFDGNPKKHIIHFPEHTKNDFPLDEVLSDSFAPLTEKTVFSGWKVYRSSAGFITNQNLIKTPRVNIANHEASAIAGFDLDDSLRHEVPWNTTISPGQPGNLNLNNHVERNITTFGRKILQLVGTNEKSLNVTEAAFEAATRKWIEESFPLRALYVYLSEYGWDNGIGGRGPMFAARPKTATGAPATETAGGGAGAGISAWAATPAPVPVPRAVSTPTDAYAYTAPHAHHHVHSAPVPAGPTTSDAHVTYSHTVRGGDEIDAIASAVNSQITDQIISTLGSQVAHLAPRSRSHHFYPTPPHSTHEQAVVSESEHTSTSTTHEPAIVSVYTPPTTTPTPSSPAIVSVYTPPSTNPTPSSPAVVSVVTSPAPVVKPATPPAPVVKPITPATTATTATTATPATLPAPTKIPLVKVIPASNPPPPKTTLAKATTAKAVTAAAAAPASTT